MLLMPGITGDPEHGAAHALDDAFRHSRRSGQEGRLLVDGMNVGASRGGGGVSGYTVDTATFRKSRSERPAVWARPKPAGRT